MKWDDPLVPGMSLSDYHKLEDLIKARLSTPPGGLYWPDSYGMTVSQAYGASPPPGAPSPMQQAYGTAPPKTFDDYFELIFMPAQPVHRWLSIKTAAHRANWVTQQCFEYLEALLQELGRPGNVFGGAAGSFTNYDVEDVCRQEFAYAVNHNHFVILPSGDLMYSGNFPKTTGQVRGAAVQQAWSARQTTTSFGPPHLVTAVDDQWDVKTDPGVGPHVAVTKAPEVPMDIKLEVKPALPARGGYCYFCWRRPEGAGFLPNDGTPACCQGCYRQFVRPEPN